MDPNLTRLIVTAAAALISVGSVLCDRYLHPHTTGAPATPIAP